MPRLFGTDGVRGIVPSELDSTLALKIGKSASYVLGKNKDVKVIIGRDTRVSGQMLLNAISSGLMEYGAHVFDAGIISTPAVSYLTQKMNADFGIVISASHNPYEYNGIKFFNHEGLKLEDKIEEEIEEYILDKDLPLSQKVGTIENFENAKDIYVDYLKNSVNNINSNLKVVFDCANGASSETCKDVFSSLVNTIIINDEYNGENINLNCGSTNMDMLKETVLKNNADLGIAFDGDADRCLLIDDKGDEVDGDYILAICADLLKKDNKLTNNTVVGTVMTNLGLKKYCEANDINFIETKVGDRYILENMLKNNYIIGGEQSGHIIFKEKANTGDGQLTALIMLELLSKENKPLSEIKKVMNKYPQVLKNVKVSKDGKENYKDDVEFSLLLKAEDEKLNNDGRILIRPSGTENLIRVMVEGKDYLLIEEIANNLSTYLNTKYGI